MDKIKEWLKLYAPAVKIAVGALAVALLVFVGLKLYAYIFYKPVTPMSQQQAETVSGVKEAGRNNDITISNGQAKEIVTQIKEIRVTEKEPVYVVQTDGKNVAKESEKAVKESHADYAIVTDKNDMDKKVDINSIDDNTKVELNQYNINAYKKVIRQVEVGKLVADDGYVVGASISKKVTDDGQYLGVGFDWIHEDDGDNKGIVKVIYSW